MLTRIISVTAAVVVFVTTYALVLPAITMETEAQCGIEAHQHSDECYTDELICKIPESPGHVHTDTCYELSQVLVCETPEHEHSVENGCYDEGGNLICELAEHHHTVDDGCYKEVKELVCDIPESEGHTHDSSCYKKVLTCGKEVHIHSTACYHIDAASKAATEAAAVASTESAAIAGTDSMMSTKASTTSEAAAFTDNLSDDEIDESNIGTIGTDTSANLENVDTTSTDSDAASANPGGESGTWTPAEETIDSAVSETNSGAEGSTASAASSSATSSTSSTASTTEKATEENAGYVPVLEELNINAVINNHTGIYYYHPESDSATDSNEASTEDSDGTVTADNNNNTVAVDNNDDSANTVTDGSAIPAEDWHRIPNNTEHDETPELGESDLLRIYLAYTIPAGSLNETNTVTRYRLPANIRLSDDQIDTINSTVNGIAAQYVNMDTLEFLDVDQYNASLGIESVEGTRTPDQDIQDYLNDLEKSGKEASEYINATVRVENVFNEDSGDYEGQDLVFTFTPYSILKNQHEYDKDGQPTRAGEELQGWVSLDLTTDQIEWITSDNDDKKAVEKTADIVFVEKDQELDVDEISTELKLVEKASADDIPTEKADAVDTAEAIEVNETEASRDEEKEDNKTEATEDDETAENEKAVEEPAVNYPSVSFDDSITVTSGTLSTDTTGAGAEENTEITVHVEADEDTFPEGTTMRLAAVTDDQMAAVTEAVEGAMAEAAGTQGTAGRTQGFHALDISFWNADGIEIEPLKPIRVSMTSEAIKRAVEDESAAPVVVHVDNGHMAATEDSTEPDDSANEAVTTEAGSDAEETAATDSDPLDLTVLDTQITPTANIIETSTADTLEENTDTLTFEAGSFSVYAIVYTVDFHYEVNGKKYEFNIPGGGFISLEYLVEVLGLVTNEENGDPEFGNEAESEAFNPDDGEVSAEDDVRLSEIEVSEATKRFVADVASVEFSNPDLVWVGKVNETTTVGRLKKDNELKVQYSSELTEEQIAEINGSTVEAGDWALFSILPFTSEESLTIIMKNGDQFALKVTDDQISNFDSLVNNERYVLYIDVNGVYYALDNTGNTVLVPDNDLDTLPSQYLWRFTSQENGSTHYDNASSWLSGGNYLDVYWTNKEKPVVSAANSDNWIPIVTLVQNGDGFYFRDLNPDRVGSYYGNTYYQCRFLKDNYNAGADTHNLQTVFGNRYYYDYMGWQHGDPYNGAATIHVYKQGSSHTVTAESNDETYGHVKYTEGTSSQQTSASHTTLEVLTENNVEKNKTVPGSFEAVPENGYKFTGWKVLHVNSWDTSDVTDWGPGATSESATIQPTVSGDLILEATFAPKKLYPFTVMTHDEKMGTVGGGNEEGSNLAGQTSFTSTSGVVIDGTGTNAYALSAVQKPLHKFVAWELKKANGQVVQTITTQDIPAHSFELTEDGMTLTAVFRKKTETEIDEGDIDTLLGSWKIDMTSDFVGVDKTAHVSDPENRIYEIDLSASSGKWAVEDSINLDFITDTSRSMYFPANLEYAKGTKEASSFTQLRTWLRYNGTIGETYYVISADNTATMYAVHYEGGEWKYRDASYYYYWKANSTQSSTPVPDSLSLAKTITGVIYKSRTAPASYQAHNGVPSSLDEYWSRLDYLYKAVMTATETLKAIDPQAAVHLTTFNKQSFNNGWIVRSTDNPLTEEQIFNSSLTEIDPSGGTRQDEGLYTSRTGEERRGTNGNGPGPGTNNGVGTGADCAFADSSHRHFAILVTDGAPNGADWGSPNDTGHYTIFGQANKLKAITDDNRNPLTLMTLGISLDFVDEDDSTNLRLISSSPNSDKYAKAANNGGQIVTAIEELVESMAVKAAMQGTVSDTLDPAFYPVKSDGTPITPGYYTMDGDPYSPGANDTSEYCRWTRDGESWTVTYYNQTFKWPTRDSNGNITKNGWEHAFYAKVKENFMGGNAIETNDVGSTKFTATHTILMNSQGEVREDTKREIVDNLNQAKPIPKSDIPTPHVNVKQLTLTENNTEWKIYVQTGVEPMPQIKALYDNILVQEVVDNSEEHMIRNKSAMLFNPPKGTEPETFYLKDVFGDSTTIDWTTLTAAREEGDPPAYVDLPYNNSAKNYGHNTGYIRLTLKKEGDTADYNDHPASSNLNDVETYVLSAQFIPYTANEMINAHGDETDTHDHSYHTTPQQQPGAEQLRGKPSDNTHLIDLFARGLGVTKTDESFAQGLQGAEFTVYRPATEEEIADSDSEIKTFEGDTGKYIYDRELSFDNNGVAFVNGVRSLTPPKTTYYMVETKAPDGYELRADPIPVVLEVTNEYTPLPVAKGQQPVTQSTKPESGMYNWLEKASLKMVSDYGILRTTGSYDPTNPDTVYGHNPDPTSEYEVMYYRISNNPGAELPATGGPGTNWLYLFGIMLTGLAGIGFAMKRRRKNIA